MDRHSPKNPPMPETTKKRGKRKKLHYPGIGRNTSVTSQIYRTNTDAITADKATESRLSRYGPSTSVRYGGMQFIW